MMQKNGLRSAQRDACVEQRSKKGQQIIAQGIALGNIEAINTPCKGKRTIAGHRPAITLLPFQGGDWASVNTQGDALGYYMLPFQGVHTHNFTNLFFEHY